MIIGISHSRLHTSTYHAILERLTFHEISHSRLHTSTYNGIIGRLTFHNLKDIPSTYHQVMKFMTPDGVVIVKEQGHYECYCTTLKETMSMDTIGLTLMTNSKSVANGRLTRTLMV